MRSDELKRRTKEFAHRCVKLARALPKGALGTHVGDQLIRCATSVACNYRAACLAQTKPTFVAKLSIVLEEVDESHFWLEFVMDEGLLKRAKIEPLFQEADELRAIFVTSRMTATGKSPKK